jgi:hypothetical protein
MIVLRLSCFSCQRIQDYNKCQEKYSAKYFSRKCKQNWFSRKSALMNYQFFIILISASVVVIFIGQIQHQCKLIRIIQARDFFLSL